MVRPKSKRHFLKRSLKWLLVIILGLIVILGLLNVASHTHNEVAGLVETISSFGAIARFLRWGVLGGIIMFWDQLIDYFGPIKGLTPEQIARAKSTRWRIAGLIIVFDLLVIESLPSRLMD